MKPKQISHLSASRLPAEQAQLPTTLLGHLSPCRARNFVKRYVYERRPPDAARDRKMGGIMYLPLHGNPGQSNGPGDGRNNPNEPTWTKITRLDEELLLASSLPRI